MAQNSYAVNTSVRLTGTFTSSGTAFDPTTITAYVMSPAGVESSYVYGTDSALQKDGTGVYHLDVVPSSAGTWSYRFEGASTQYGNTASEATFFVPKSAFYS